MRTAPWIDDTLAPNGQSVRENFAVWFGNSKVVDAKGLPVGVYHGTQVQFTAFNQAPIFVAKSKSAADNHGPIHMKLYVAILNPALLDDDKFRALAWNKSEVERLKGRGFDGAKAIGQNVWAAFDPRQVKSAVANSGLFAVDSPSLTDAIDGLNGHDAASLMRATVAVQALKVWVAADALNSGRRAGMGVIP